MTVESTYIFQRFCRVYSFDPFFVHFDYFPLFLLFKQLQKAVLDIEIPPQVSEHLGHFILFYIDQVLHVVI